MSRDAPPPLPGAYTVGEKVYFKWANQTLESNNKVMYGQQGEVVGPARGESCKGKGVSVRFPGNKNPVGCFLDSVRRLRAASAATTPARASTHATPATPRASPRQPLPRGPSPHCMRQPLAPQPTARVRERCGGRGRGVRAGRFDDSAREGAAAEPYPPYSLRLVAAAQVSRDAPPLPGGYTVGDRVFFTGATRVFFENGYELVHGQHGKVMGPATSVGPPLPNMGVSVLFPGYKGNIDCSLGVVRRPRAASAATSRLTPASAPQLSSAGGCPQVNRKPPPPLPGGYAPGDKAFYTGTSQTWDDGDKLVHGQQGEVVGPAFGEAVSMRFPDKKSNIGCFINSVRRLRTAPPPLRLRSQPPPLRPTP